MNPRTIVKKLVPKSIFRKIEPYGHLGESAIFNAKNGFPARGIKVIGVTGTDGKTTTSFLIYRMLHEAGVKAGIMTTVGYGANGEWSIQKEHRTTVPSPLLFRRIKQLRAKKVEWLVFEITSHALAQNRAWGVPYSVGVFTNLSHEHLDYHKTMENYRAAKLRLFKYVAGNRRGLRTGIVNADDAEGKAFARTVPKVLTYGIKHGDLKAAGIKSTSQGSNFRIEGSELPRPLNIELHLPGEFNIYNALAAAGVGITLGLTPDQIERGIAALEGVPGRMDLIDGGQDFSVVVDYAVTPGALEKALDELRKVTEGKLSVVFGATGDRDKSKRSAMGEAAAEKADRIYLTDDETYTENPENIRQAVYRGIENAGAEAKTKIIDDRKKAIELAFKEAKAGDTVLLAGIGHQTTRNMGGRDEPWNEREIAKELINKIKK